MQSKSPLHSELVVDFARITSLQRHEEVDAANAARLMVSIEALGVWTKPILIERQSSVILDGHHRYWSARALGLATIPIVQVEYNDPRLAVTSWREAIAVTRAIVLDAAKSGHLLPKKTSRHVFDGALPNCEVSLASLALRDVA